MGVSQLRVCALRRYSRNIVSDSRTKASGSILIKLQPGDILLWRIGPSASWIDRLIGWGERKTGDINSAQVNYYHAGMVGPDALHYYESKPGGFRNTPIPSPWPDYLEVKRFIIPLTPDELTKMWIQANSQLGTGYNYIGVLSAGFIEVAGKPFCSESVWRLCTFAARVICPWKKCLSPDDLEASSVLRTVDQ